MSVGLLAFSPHPDDAELFCGGIIAKAAAAGHSTAIVDLSKGELSSRGDLKSRAEETHKATAILRVSHRENLGLPDGGITGDDAAITKVVSAIRKLQPEIVLAPYWRERHPDHEAAASLITRAVFLAGVKKFLPAEASFSPKQILYYMLRYEFRPSFITDITAVHKTKMDAIACYASQLHSAQSGAASTLLSSPLTLDAIAGRDRHYGAMIGAEYGEAYLVRSIVSIDDPVRYFGSQRPAIFSPDYD